MGNGLRYETGRDMPPGMQELTADKIVQHLREAAAMAAQVEGTETEVEKLLPRDKFSPEDRDRVAKVFGLAMTPNTKM